jgi:excisionase family DNA binding protein
MKPDAQLMLFEIEQESRPDGSFIVRPRKIPPGREINRREAAKLLGIDTDTISRLIRLGEISGWQLPTARGNGAFRIALQSVLDYKARRIAAARDC